MKQLTLAAFLGYTASVLAMNAMNPAIAGDGFSQTHFTVEPTAQQTLFDKMGESVEFIGKINRVLVDEITGEKLGLSSTGLIMGRADLTNGKRRVPRDLHNLDKNSYLCVHTEFDVAIKWATLDKWAKFPDFQKRISDHLVKTYAQNLMMVGFNGVSATTPTDRTANPLGQDVNKGWLQQIRENAETHVLDQDAVDTTTVRFGAGAPHYNNLDAVVKDAVNKLLPSWSRNADLVAIVGNTLLDDKYFNLINENDKPTEINAAQMILANKRLGGLPAYSVPYFPENTILITTFDNLSIYEQDQSRRRTMRDNPDTLQYEDLQSSNLAFVVEDYDLAAMIENLVEVPAA